MNTPLDAASVYRNRRHTAFLAGLAMVAPVWLIAMVAMAVPDPLPTALWFGRSLAAAVRSAGSVLGGSPVILLVVVGALALTEQDSHASEEDR